MARQWYVIEDRQGGEFGMYRLYTAEEWLDQAVNWLESDGAFDEDNFTEEDYRAYWGQVIKENPQELIDYIDDLWELTMVEQGVDGHDYDTDFPEDVEGCTDVTASENVEDINPGNIYEYAVKMLPAEDIDHHESDLYIRKTPESTALINKMQYKDSGLLTTFRSNIAPHDTWYDLPFCYTPDWRSKMAGTPIKNASQVKASRWYYKEPMTEEELASLKKDILALPGCDKVDIDTHGMEEIGYIMILPGYEGIPLSDPQYYEKRKQLLKDILRVVEEHGLSRTEDRIEDYGSCWYIVLNTNKPKTDKYDEY